MKNRFFDRANKKISLGNAAALLIAAALSGQVLGFLRVKLVNANFSQFGGHVPPPTEAPDAPPSLFTAVQEQIGLKLETTKTMVDVLVIDHVEKPSEN